MAATAIKKSKDDKTPFTAGGQVTREEWEALKALAERTGRSKSDIVRRAIKIMMRLDHADKIDWAASTDSE